MKLLRISLVLYLLIGLFTLPTNAEQITESHDSTITTTVKKHIIIPTGKRETLDAIVEKKATIQKERQDLLESIKEKREALKTQIKEEREEFKKRLEGIRDEKKKTIVQRVDSRLSNINTNRTQQFTTALQKLDGLIDKIATKTSTLKLKGADVSSVETAITEAKKAIDSAKNAVSTQASKEYIATLTDETTLNQTFKTTIHQLKTELKATHLAVDNARKAVRLAATELTKVMYQINPTKPEDITVTP